MLCVNTHSRKCVCIVGRGWDFLFPTIVYMPPIPPPGCFRGSLSQNRTLCFGIKPEFYAGIKAWVRLYSCESSFLEFHKEVKDEEDERGLIFSEKISLIRRASTCSWPWHSSQKMLKFSMILFLLRKMVDFKMWYKRNFELMYFVSLSWCLWVQKKVSFVFSCKRPPLSTS